MNVQQAIELLLADIVNKRQEFSRFAQELPLNLTVPKLKKFGNFSSNVALILAKKLEKSSLEIARTIERELQQKLAPLVLSQQIERIEIKEPGFINFFLSQSCLYQILLEIRKKKDRFGSSHTGAGQTVHIEFVSANPTGPLNVAHGRQAAFGDTLANLLEFSGYKVTREYYLNDEGVQIDILGESLRAKYCELLGVPAEFPESGYRGKYIEDLALKLQDKYGRSLLNEKQNKTALFSDFAIDKILQEIKEDLLAFGVKFDNWFSQKQLSKSRRIEQALRLLKKKDFLYQKEGAWWLATTRFGDDKDRVVIKSDTNLTYLAPDIAYHQHKYRHKFSRMINIWGPDHHGYIGRLKAAISCLGYQPQRLVVLIVQLVSLSSADKIIPMSTRLGQYVSLHDIIQAVGKDAGRFFFLMRKMDSHLHFDLELAKKQSLDNPVYYIQYAHARIINILKFAQMAKGRKIDLDKKADLSVLKQPEELDLIQALRDFPLIVKSCTINLEPHRLVTYLQDLAKDFHHYYEKHKVVVENPQLTQARLVLVDVARIVLHNGLRLLAISAPEKM